MTIYNHETNRQTTKTTMPNYPKLANTEIHRALRFLALRHDLDGVSDYLTNTSIEANAHELAHAVDFGLHHDGFSSRAWSQRISELDRSMTDEAANAHELATLRIQVAACALLGVRFSLKRLVRTAQWRLRLRPPTRAVTAPLTEHEHQAVQDFLGLVHAAAQKLRRCDTYAS